MQKEKPKKFQRQKDMHTERVHSNNIGTPEEFPSRSPNRSLNQVTLHNENEINVSELPSSTTPSSQTPSVYRITNSNSNDNPTIGFIQAEPSEKSDSTKSQDTPPKNNERSEKLEGLFPLRPKIKTSYGQPIKIATNYFQIDLQESNKMFFSYAVYFEPELPDDSFKLRRKLIYTIREEIQKKFGCFFFNNTMIYCLECIENPQTYKATIKDQNQEYKIIIKFASVIKNYSSEILPVYKKFFYGLVRNEKLIIFKRSFFNKEKMKRVENLEIWPGFSPSINIFNDKVLLNLNMMNKVIRLETGLEYLLSLNYKFRSNQKDFQEKAQEVFKGTSVLTRYNHDKTFTINKIDFSKNPRSIFQTKNGPISYIEYYSRKYNLRIKDVNQPLLEANGKKKDEIIHIIPEFCYMTGLTDEMRSNFNLMKQVSQYTIGIANEKMKECIEQLHSLLSQNKNHKDGEKWRMNISKEPLKIMGKKLSPGIMEMGKSTVAIENNREIDRQVQCEMKYSPKSIDNWCIFYSSQFKQNFEKQFLQTFKLSSQTFHFYFCPPKIYEVDYKSYNAWEKKITENITPGTQLIVIIMPGGKGKGFFYNEIKTLLNSKIGIPNQVILEQTISKGKGLRSILNKLIIQINAKLGGIPWAINNLPCSSIPTMIVSYITYKNVLSSCGTFDHLFSRYISKSLILKDPNQITNDNINTIFNHLLNKFKEYNKLLPSNMIIFREGITPSLHKSNTMIKEIKAIKNTINEQGINVKITFIVINKKHNLKAVTLDESNKYSNIPSGTLIDEGIVGENYQFYLVGQQSRQGISQSSQYSILIDEINLQPQEIQLLSYKLCFLYFNWTGGIKTPAPTQYAKKLATLIGDKMSFKNQTFLPDERLGSLFFL